MNTILFIFSALILVGCTSVKLVDSWEPLEIGQTTHDTIVVLGINENLTTRIFFEENLKKELESHGLQAVESAAFFNLSFRDSKRSEDVKETKIMGVPEGLNVDDKTSGIWRVKDTNNSPKQVNLANNQKRSGKYYYRVQNIDYDSGCNNVYKIYILEIGIFILNEKDVESFFWMGAFKIVNPVEMKNSVHYYVEVKTKQLKKEL